MESHTKAARLPLTPAQYYAVRMINAIDSFLDNPDDTDWSDEILMYVLERPKTLRSALAAYLHKSKSEQLYRKISHKKGIQTWKQL